MKSNKVKINTDFLRKTIRVKSLKREWLSQQLHINPKTITRWTTGKVKHTDLPTIFRLSQILECAPEELIIEEVTSVQVSISALKESIIDANLPLMVSPSDNWPLLDALTRLGLAQASNGYETGKLNNWLSIANWRMGRYDQAREYAMTALKIAEHYQLSDVRAKALFNLGTIDSLEKKYDDALETLQTCLIYVNDFKSSADKASLYTNLSMAYFDIENYRESLYYQEKAIELFEELNRPYNLSIAMHCIGMIYEATGDRDKAKTSYLKALALSIQSDYTIGIKSVKEKLNQIDAQMH